MTRFTCRGRGRVAFLGTAACLAVLTAGLKAHAAPDSTTGIAADPQVQKVVAADTDFGLRLLAQLAPGDAHGNAFFSPFSIAQALDLALNGAGGQTRNDIAQALGLNDLTTDQLNAANGQLLPALKSSDPKIQLSVANALWSDTGFTFDKDYADRCRQFYQAQAATVDFGTTGADVINDWISRNTQGKIAKLLAPEDLRGQSIVLTDAVYFHGQWQTAFRKDDTKDAPFTLPGGDTKTVPMMTHGGTYPYLETDQFQAVALPYGAGRIRFDVFLPKAGTDIDTFLGTIDAKAWQDWQGRMKPTTLTLSLPRFQTDFLASLKGTLGNLGMGSAFGPGADLTPMGLPQEACLTAALHEAILSVDEEGTTAAAATAIVAGGFGGHMGPPPIVVRVDHPFVCAIHDDKTNALLFLGVIRNPQ